MELISVVLYKDSSASYRIKVEAPGVYHADLVGFDGADVNSPPSTVTLIRSIRSWTGSIDDEALLKQLGDAMEAHLKKKRHMR